MVDQLSSFADEVTRVAREVGTEGRLGGQAQVRGVSGTWRDLTDSVNSMAANLTDQVRNIAQVATAVARGDLSQKITVEAKGEVAALAETMNAMVDQLLVVRRRGDPRGPRGRHRGQARRPGRGAGRGGHLEGPHRRVNSMAGNLTSQVRNIAQIVTAVAQRRPVAEDHRRREGRGRGTRRHDQLADRHAAGVRRAGDDGRPRGRHRGQARRPGRGPGRRRHLEGPHRTR